MFTCYLQVYSIARNKCSDLITLKYSEHLQSQFLFFLLSHLYISLPCLKHILYRVIILSVHSRYMLFPSFKRESSVAAFSAMAADTSSAAASIMPDWPFHNFRPSRSGDQWNLYSSGTLGNGFQSSIDMEGSIGCCQTFGLTFAKDFP